MACRELIELKGLFQWTEAEMERLQEAELTRIRNTTTPVLQQTTADVQHIAADVDHDDSVVAQMQYEIADLKALAVKGGPHCMAYWLWCVCVAWCVLCCVLSATDWSHVCRVSTLLIVSC